MHYRALVVLCCAALLAACGSDRPKTDTPPAPTPTRSAKPAEVLGPLPAYQRELSGTLLEIPAGATWNWPCWSSTNATARNACWPAAT